MKSILLILTLFFISFTSFSQGFKWSEDLPAIPTSNISNRVDVVENGNIISVLDSLGKVVIYKYNPNFGTWERKISSGVYSGNSLFFEVKRTSTKLWIFLKDASENVHTFNYDISTNTIVEGASIYMTMLNSVSFDVNSNSVICFYCENTNQYIMTYNVLTNTWNSAIDVSSAFNYSYNSALSVHHSATKVYYAASGIGSNFLFTAPISNPTTLTPYNSSGANDGKIYQSGSPYTAGTFNLVSNGTNEPVMIIHDNSSYKSFEKPISTSTITIDPGTDSPLSFAVSANASKAYSSKGSKAYMLTLTGTPGSGMYPDFRVYERDFSTTLWTQYGSNIPDAGISNFSIFSDPISNHVSINYSTSTLNKNRVSDTVSMVDNTKTVLYGGTCAGEYNIIFRELVIKDSDKDGPIRITGITEPTSTISGISYELIDYKIFGTSSYSYYRVKGYVPTTGNFNFIINFTDGYEDTSYTYNGITIGSSFANTFNFISPINFCSNENTIDLTSYLTFYHEGVFSINGQNISGVNIDPSYYYSIYPTGFSIDVTNNNQGCLQSASTTISFPALATASVNTVPADCGNTNGSATVTFTPGDSPGYTLKWSNGLTTNTITDLSPGAYFYNITDDYGCHVRGVANVEANGVTVTPTINNVSCHGLNDGSISVSISNPNTYQFAWSNGKTLPTITNLEAGAYTLSIWDVNGCQTHYTYIVTQPAPIDVNFNYTVNPACGTSTGYISTIVSGEAPLALEWLETGATTPTLSNASAGLYNLKVTDANGCIKVYPYHLNNYDAPLIKSVVIPSKCGANDGKITVEFVPQGSGVSFDSCTWSNGETSQINSNLAPGVYTIVTNSTSGGNTCYSAKSIEVPSNAPSYQPICIVTVDTATTTNLVAWEKVETLGISHYNIYRESDLAGNYLLSGSVPATEISVFNDVIASPMNRSWRYKIAAVDACGVEGPISIQHKTMHMKTIEVLADGSYDINWDDYEGPAGYSGYRVWRKSNLESWNAVSPLIAPGTETYNDMPLTGSMQLDYYVEMVINTPCSPQKAQDFNTCRSNRERGQFSTGVGNGNSNNAIDEHETSNLKVYPNPTNALLTIENTSTGSVEYQLTTLAGELLVSGKCLSQHTIIDLQQVAQGTYFLILKTENSKEIRKICKN
ncbi:MAG TPA: T9SS type A sorting domain-containing protein [Fluviicola sp.]|nr:T9SS type A sorting domain-containing protein [Fluviicola sp.]